MISMYSRRRRIGAWKGTPWKCSMTLAPLLPRPMSMRPPLRSSSEAKVLAMTPGEREKTFMMPLPTWMRSVALTTSLMPVTMS